MTSFYQMETHLTLNADPVHPMHAASKQYVDNKVKNVDGSRFVMGTIEVANLPAFSGDVSSVRGTNVLTLNNTGVVAGVINNMTVDGKGRVVSGSLTQQNTSNLSWSIVQNKPTTLGGYGISDVLSRTVGGTVATITMSGAMSGDGTAIVTRAVVGTMMSDIDLNVLKTGEIIRFPSGTTPAGFYRANGAVLDKASNAALYSVLGDYYYIEANKQTVEGRPWSLQASFNTQQVDDITGWTAGTLPTNVTLHHVAVTKNRVYIIGGFKPVGGYTNEVWTAPIDEMGVVGAWTAGTPMGYSVGAAQLIMTKSRVYLIGGYRNGTYGSGCSYAPINADGTLGAWVDAPSFPTLSYSGWSAVAKGYAFVMGGDANRYIYSAPINADGSLGGWSIAASKTPDPHFHTNIVVSNDRLFSIAGMSDGIYYRNIYYAIINANGTLGTWYGSGSLPEHFTKAGVMVVKDRAFLFNGINSGGVVNKTYSVNINADGTIGTWSTKTPLPTGVADVRAFATKSRLYLVGEDKMYYAPFPGVTNDYIGLIVSNTINTSSQFKLPDYSNNEVDGLFYYIKY